ncbi:MAG: hypothetical protein K1X74_16690 [Pirellulales bacterium]|nr:hypothetical protein [Pirellulales bacterium]
MLRADLTEHDWLRIWERAYGRRPYEFAVTLLAAAFEGAASDDVWQWPLGLRDAWVLRARRALLGDALVVTGPCPECGEVFQIELSTGDMIATLNEPEDRLIEHREGAWHLAARMLNSRDVQMVAALAADLRPNELLNRCIVSVSRNGLPATISEVPEDVREKLIGQLEQADPGAEIRLDVECPGCQVRRSFLLDVAQVFWLELNHWAQRLLAEVHVLAQAYGWTEPEIVALGPWRRGVYLEMVRS